MARFTLTYLSVALLTVIGGTSAIEATVTVAV